MRIHKSIFALLVPGFILAFTSTAIAAEGTPAGQAGGTWVWWVAPIGSLLALGFALYFYKKMMEAPEGTDKMKEIAKHVREGAYAYLFRQYSVVTLVFIVLCAIFAFLAYKGVQNPFVPVAFLTGGFFSGLCGFLGMKTATNASARTAQGASKSLNSGLQVAFRSGAVMGLVVVGFGLFDISMWYLILDRFIYNDAHMTNGLTLWGLKLVEARGNHHNNDYIRYGRFDTGIVCPCRRRYLYQSRRCRSRPGR